MAKSKQDEKRKARQVRADQGIKNGIVPPRPGRTPTLLARYVQGSMNSHRMF